MISSVHTHTYTLRIFWCRATAHIALEQLSDVSGWRFSKKEKWFEINTAIKTNDRYKCRYKDAVFKVWDPLKIGVKV